ncbi:MAG TPA: CRTAC1 family protein [bacterium]|nr:CRTAC1 family protein [bacterium]
MARWIKILLFLILPAGLLFSGPVFFRIHHARIESGHFKWDVEVRSDAVSPPVLGDCDFYFHVYSDGFIADDPALSRLHDGLADPDRYALRTGRARDGRLTWVALDFQGGTDGFRPDAAWTRLFTASLPVADPRATSGLYWHRSASGFAGSQREPLTAGLLGASNVTLTDSALTFQDVTEEWAELTGEGAHGVFWADADGDGFPDLYLPFYTSLGAAMRDRFYWNEGGRRFHEQAETRGVDDPDGGSHGACFADLDNDGHFDLINASTADAGKLTGHHNSVYRNRGGGYFDDITATIPAIHQTHLRTRALCAFDMNGNGLLDIFAVSGHLGTNDAPEDQRNEIYRNDGGMRFTALSGHILETVPAGQGVTDTDYDGDGRVDLIIANRTGDLNILRNLGNGEFERIPPSEIGILHRAGDGITMADIDNDGHLDMLLTTGQSPGKADGAAHLYRNRGDGTFEFLRTFENIRGYMGGFMDLDNDGDLDLIFPCSAHVYLNDGTGNFSPGPSLPLGDLTGADPRGIAFADFDRDGYMDIALGDKKDRFHLIRNASFYPNRWLRVELTAPNGQAGAFGSRLFLYPAGALGGELLGFRETRSSNGYLAQDDPVLHFGLGLRDAADVLVRFPCGGIAVRRNVDAMQTLHVGGADPRVRFRVFLEGAYDPETGRMRTDLADQGLLPTTSPYARSPLTLSGIPGDATDWILIELRKNPDGPAAAFRSALVLADGEVTDGLSGAPGVHFDLPPGPYTAIVRHRNHLPVRTSYPFFLSDTAAVRVDLTGAGSMNPGVEIRPGVVGLIAGNADDRDREILASDLAAIRRDLGSSSPAYRNADITLDGRVTKSDYDLAVRRMLEGAYSGVNDP